jgi:hypothetical protein
MYPFRVIASFLSRQRIGIPPIAPSNGNADISRRASRKIHDLVSNAVAARLQVIGPELKDFLSHSRKRRFPAPFLPIDSPPIVGAERIGKSVDLNLGRAIAHSPLNDGAASLTFSSSVKPEGSRSLSIKARFSASAAASLRGSCSAFSASFKAASFWISFAVGSRSSIFSAMADPS